MKEDSCLYNLHILETFYEKKSILKLLNKYLPLEITFILIFK